MNIIEEKSKLYDEAIKRAKALYNNNRSISGNNVIIENIFPEFKDSIDERIRKALIKSFEIHDLKALIIPGFSSKEVIAWLEKQGEQKPVAWTEEDENHVKAIISTLEHCKTQFQAAIESYNTDIDWLKSLKDRVGYEANCTTTKEWSEEDENYSSYISATLQCYYRLREDRNDTNRQENLDKAINWLYNKLKSLRPQKQWKPSKEQMEALWNVYEGGEKQSALASLYNDLKKL